MLFRLRSNHKLAVSISVFTFLIILISHPLTVIEVFANVLDLGFSSSEYLKIEEIMTKRRQHLEQVCRSKGWSPDDPVPPNEDAEPGELYHLQPFNSFVCL